MKKKYSYLTSKSAKIARIRAVFAKFFLSLLCCNIISRTDLQQEALAPSGSEFGKKEEKHGGKYCVAGDPRGISCTNRQYTEVVSIHNFPDPKKA